MNKLFKTSHYLRKVVKNRKEAEKRFQNQFDELHDSWLDIAIDRVKSYIAVYAIRQDKLHESPILEVFSDILHDIVMGCRRKLPRIPSRDPWPLKWPSVTKDMAAALLDCGVMHCMDIRDDGAMELVQHEFVAVKAIMRFYQERRTTYSSNDMADTTVVSSSRMVRQEIDAKEDPVIQYCIRRFKSEGEGLPDVFEDFMMRHYQLNLSRFPSVYESKMVGCTDPQLKYYKIVADQFINEKSGVNFVDYLSDPWKYKEMGFFHLPLLWSMVHFRL